MKMGIIQFTQFSIVALTASVTLYATDLSKAYDMPNAGQILEKDRLAKPTKFTMPKSCKLDDLEAIARGRYIFHNLNGKKAKDKPPKGLVKFITKNGKKVPKQFGNCVACHNIEGARVQEILDQI